MDSSVYIFFDSEVVRKYDALYVNNSDSDAEHFLKIQSIKLLVNIIN